AFQKALNQLEPFLTLQTPMYLILRRRPITTTLASNLQHVSEQHQQHQLVFITYVPYRADSKTTQALLAHRNKVIEELRLTESTSTGAVVSLVCKEIGEIVDGRSWDERDGTEGESWGGDGKNGGDTTGDDEVRDDDEQVKDLGFKKNKCRLCDRRMKNPIDDDALDALSARLSGKGDCVQLTIDNSTNTLKLTCPPHTILAPSSLSSHLPRATPGFTFYRHPLTASLVFIYYSPDTASVQLRMKHTLALPGLVNVIARDVGAHVDWKVEIHDVEDLDLDLDLGEDGDGQRGGGGGGRREGKYRSMYLRNEIVGTESQWEGMERV
ncbi:hypothetical protein DM02DRAFT_514817, partial [Periconia macrospinosa]